MFILVALRIYMAVLSMGSDKSYRVTVWFFCMDIGITFESACKPHTTCACGTKW